MILKNIWRHASRAVWIALACISSMTAATQATSIYRELGEVAEFMDPAPSVGINDELITLSQQQLQLSDVPYMANEWNDAYIITGGARYPSRPNLPEYTSFPAQSGNYWGPPALPAYPSYPSYPYSNPDYVSYPHCGQIGPTGEAYTSYPPYLCHPRNTLAPYTPAKALRSYRAHYICSLNGADRVVSMVTERASKQGTEPGTVELVDVLGSQPYSSDSYVAQGRIANQRTYATQFKQIVCLKKTGSQQ
jgi:hypothetical protein